MGDAGVVVANAIERCSRELVTKQMLDGCRCMVAVGAILRWMGHHRKDEIYFIRLRSKTSVDGKQLVGAYFILSMEAHSMENAPLFLV